MQKRREFSPSDPSPEFGFKPVYNEPPPEFFEFKPVVNDVFRALIAARRAPSTSTPISTETQSTLAYQDNQQPEAYLQNPVDYLDASSPTGGTYILTSEVIYKYIFEL